MDTRGKSRSRPEAGQALVEAALVLPILLIVVMAIGRYGITFNNYLMLTNAVRSCARQLVVSRAPNFNACTPAIARFHASAFNLANLGDPQFAFTGGSICTNLVAGSDVTVTATYGCNLRVFGINFAPGCTLTARTTERIE